MGKSKEIEGLTVGDAKRFLHQFTSAGVVSDDTLVLACLDRGEGEYTLISGMGVSYFDFREKVLIEPIGRRDRIDKIDRQSNPATACTVIYLKYENHE